MQVQFRIPAREKELREFFEHIDSKERNKFIIESLKLGLAKFDINFIHSHMKQLDIEKARYEDILEWKRAYDKLSIEESIRVQQSKTLREYFESYEQREEYGEDVQHDYLIQVLPDIQRKLNYSITLEQFKDFYKNRNKLEVE